jgi:ArsR family transcriptional regulator, arsenate/arsenite/antimonite-responsive transcriptional repressor
MDRSKAVDAFAALSQETRLSALLAMVEHGHTGLSAGDLADRLAVPHNTLSFHLSQLERSGLVASRRNGRQVIYFAKIDALQSLGQFLLANCCIRESAESSGDSAALEGTCP